MNSLSNITKTILIVGGSGIIGRSLVRNLAKDKSKRVIAISRRPEDTLPENTLPLSIDLSEPVQESISSLADATHMLYAGFIDASSWDAQRWPNVALFRNSVEFTLNNCPNLKHVVLIQGTKAYGAHLGPFKTPAKETDPRINNGYFYDDQFDVLSEYALKTGWTWTVLRPHVVIGPAFRSPLNLVTVLGVYCSLLKAQGRSLVFPGPNAAFDALYQATDADLLSRAIDWAGSSKSAMNEIFNITNGDYFRWRNVWSRIADLFGMECGGVESQDLQVSMADADVIWNELSNEHDLVMKDLGEMVSWRFANYVFGTTWDVMSDSTKIRRHGFHELIDSEEMLLSRLNELRKLKIIPIQ